MAGRARALRGFIRGRGTIAVAVLLGVAFTMPSLGVGWIADDCYQRWILTRGSGGNDAAHVDAFADVRPAVDDMFDFADGDAARTRRMKSHGLLPWWTYDRCRAHFWRPVTVLTHRLDYALWPTASHVMHAHNILWYALLITCVGLLHRRTMGRALPAAIATVLFAVDDAHSIPVGWIASRNALIAATFGVLAILAHARWRDGTRRGPVFALIATALFAASMLSAEAGVATLGYLIAFALIMDRGGTWRSRLWSVAPYLVVLVVWRAIWSARGYGVFGVEGLYTDPLREPLRFARLLIIRLPTLIAAQFAYPPADLATILNDTGKIVIAVVGVAILTPITVASWPMLRHRRATRFWLIGMLLSAIPLSATFSANRQLLFVGIGGFALVGQVLAAAAHRRFWRGLDGLRRLARFAFIAALVVLHAAAAPVVLVVMSAWPLGPPSMWQAMTELPGLTAADAKRDVIVVNHPLAANMMETLTIAAMDGGPLPRSAATLAPSSVELRVSRPDERTLVIRAEEGFFPDEIARLLCSPENPPAVGQTIRLPAVAITVLSQMPDGRPSEVRYDFAVALEDASLHWFTWRNGAFGPWTPPAVGREIVLPRGRFPF